MLRARHAVSRRRPYRLAFTGIPSAGAYGTPALIVPPGQPTITSVTPDNGSVTVAFSPPASAGGGTIIEYEALEEAS